MSHTAVCRKTRRSMLDPSNTERTPRRSRLQEGDRYPATMIGDASAATVPGCNLFEWVTCSAACSASRSGYGFVLSTSDASGNESLRAEMSAFVRGFSQQAHPSGATGAAALSDVAQRCDGEP